MNDLQLKKKETRKITNGYYEGRKNALGLTGADCAAEELIRCQTWNALRRPPHLIVYWPWTVAALWYRNNILTVVIQALHRLHPLYISCMYLPTKVGPDHLITLFIYNKKGKFKALTEMFLDRFLTKLEVWFLILILLIID